LLPQLKRHKLDLVADCLGLPKFNHHRASDDAMTVALMLGRFTKELALKGITRTSELNSFVRQLIGTGGARHVYHITLLAKNRTGLRNMYKLISLAHLEHFYRHPVIPRNLLIENREGLLVGSACENSEVYSAVVSGKSWPEIRQIAEFYDYLEIQPVANNMFMVRRGTASDVEQLRRYNKSMVLLGEELCKPVCATGDVHFLEPEDEIFRRILLASKDYEDADEELPLYFRTTDEMLEEFSYLGEEKALEVVVKNPRIIADKCESIKPLPDGLFPPTIENSAEELKSLVYGRMREMYGDEPPQLVKDRVNIEMEAILSRNYDVIYMSAQKLVKKSLDAGYLVGSRGSVGSSIVAYLSGITEVNSLPPHYRCPNCRYSDFEAGKEYGCGVDMPDAFCPVCGEKYVKDGFNIPFETFLGYGGKKVPDIDLNFSGEYQARAHKYTSELFGENHVFRAGTISVYKDKTAYGIVRSYLDSRGIDAPRAEVDRLVKGCVGVKRTTGQHPGGMVVIPQDKEVYDFCPVQYPADNRDSGSVTTHFEYHSMEDNLLKLDILGHDDPTMIKLLEEMTGVDAKKIPLDDPETMSLFTSNRALGIENDSTLGPTGACAIPEFGTKFVREMLIDTKPTQFDTLIRISGFSHGTAVWLDNARDLILSGTATVNEAIGCRDDIMLYLISKGMDMEESFNIMESVRKGKGLKKDPNWEKDMREHGVPEWYIDSCNKIQYMFPKAHAVAYVIMAFRIAWFKVHYPLAFYAAYFSVRAKAFDATVMCRGLPAVKAKMKELKAKDKDASAVEQDMLVTLEVCYEFYLRGFSFLPIELMQSDATRFLIKDGKLLPPFSSIPGMGEAAAQSIADCRRSAEFVSVEEFAAASGISKTNLDLLRSLGALGNLPETNQLSLF
ncbi:MAG: PolC-type DNA polymerase III, partial [Oscillospiraceae bacterium]